MAEPSKDTDQSMEDILQSIKRIIADEGEPAPAVAGSDVLELTELLAEDAAPPAADSAPAFEEVPTVTGSQDALDALFDDAPAAPAPEPEPEMAAPIEEAPTMHMEKPLAAAPAAKIESPAVDEEKLISDATLAASIAALNAIPHPVHTPVTHHSAVFRSGTTVEDLVIESLKPMLKEWLDDNLPALVRSLVEREIRRLSA